ncbi:hypothetical protein EDD85DRAFT_441856 [Armillaria nabsnona]|nr:hypothetical protein EDD85DRAFT_441856 [Armillaria nabsnona]
MTDASAIFDKKLAPLSGLFIPGQLQRRAWRRRIIAPRRLPVTNIIFGSVTAGDTRILSHLQFAPFDVSPIKIAVVLDHRYLHRRTGQRPGAPAHRRRIRLVQSLMGQDAWSRVRQPERIRHLVLTGLLADMGMWSTATGELSKAFLDNVQKGLAVDVADIVRPGAQ